MTAENFDRSLAKVLKYEGGYSNDPGDPGGATMWGITHIDYDAYRNGKGLSVRNVRKMTTDERDDIYRNKYWARSRCDDLPSGIDFVVFDGAVNSGIGQSAKWLQRALGITADGKIGPQTIAAAEAVDGCALVNSICDQRLRFLKGLKHWSIFGKGWAARVKDVRATGLAWVEDTPKVRGAGKAMVEADTDDDEAPVAALPTAARAEPDEDKPNIVQTITDNIPLATRIVTPIAATVGGAKVVANVPAKATADGVVRVLDKASEPLTKSKTVWASIGAAISAFFGMGGLDPDANFIEKAKAFVTSPGFFVLLMFVFLGLIIYWRWKDHGRGALGRTD